MFDEKAQALIDAYLKTISTNRTPLLSADKRKTIQKVKESQQERIKNIA